jgi:hypothetical protein
MTGVRNFVAMSDAWESSALSPPPHFAEHNAEHFS